MRCLMRMLFVPAIMVLMGSMPVLAGEAMQDNREGMIVRIAEIAVYPEYLDAYLSYAKEVAQRSVENEEGVLAIYPMQVIGNNAQIRILEIYRNQAAYEKHIASPHFKKYKAKTLPMVKSLDLVDANPLCPEIFERIFKKAK